VSFWWKTGFHMVTRIHAVAHGGFDGGGLINADTGTRFYTPPLGNTVVVPAQPIMTFTAWTQIDSALKAGEEPPMWHEYVTSAHQRMESGDKLAAILDLAVAAEARIRRFLNDNPPKSLKGKKAIRNLKIADVFSGWSSYGFPAFSELASTQKLFTVRNGIMHSGTHKDADAPFFKIAAGAVTRLLATL
jgi:hypothetical protein